MRARNVVGPTSVSCTCQLTCKQGEAMAPWRQLIPHSEAQLATSVLPDPHLQLSLMALKLPARKRARRGITHLSFSRRARSTLWACKTLHVSTTRARLKTRRHPRHLRPISRSLRTIPPARSFLPTPGPLICKLRPTDLTSWSIRLSTARSRAARQRM